MIDKYVTLNKYTLIVRVYGSYSDYETYLVEVRHVEAINKKEAIKKAELEDISVDFIAEGYIEFDEV